jgi:hybrid polyketide synthase / nonribosomal peptide synthetase ACE1
VGLIKTVIGHTEGTAGIAAIIKAFLALPHKVILSNILFNHLSPAIQPFYGKLQILSAAKPWPQISKGASRRASVNSFGELSNA